MKVLQRAVYDPMYPDSDGKPMADNDVQWEWIVLLKQNMLRLFAKQDDVAISADMLIYPDENDPNDSIAPDVFVAFGRPRKERFSYTLAQEDNIFPQVIFEVLSRSNRRSERMTKRNYYEEHQVEEYFEIDPLKHQLKIYTWSAGQLMEIDDPFEYTSSRLGIRFVRTADGKLAVLGPDVKLFLSYQELLKEGEEFLERAEKAEDRIEEASHRAEEAIRLARIAEAAKEKFAAKLRELGLDPDAL